MRSQRNRKLIKRKSNKRKSNKRKSNKRKLNGGTIRNPPCGVDGHWINLTDSRNQLVKCIDCNLIPAQPFEPAHWGKTVDQIKSEISDAYGVDDWKIKIHQDMGLFGGLTELLGHAVVLQGDTIVVSTI